MPPTSETLKFPTRRTYRTCDAKFKAEMVAAWTKPGASISALALTQGMNPNVLRRWLREHERGGLHQLNAGLAGYAQCQRTTDQSQRETPSFHHEPDAYTNLATGFDIGKQECNELRHDILRFDAGQNNCWRRGHWILSVCSESQA